MCTAMAAATAASPFLAGTPPLHTPDTAIATPCRCSLPSPLPFPRITLLRLPRNPPPWQLSRTHLLLTHFRAEASTWCSGGNGFEEQAARMAEGARRKFGDAAKSVSEQADRVFHEAGRKFGEFQEKSDVEGKSQRFFRQANLQLEELAYNIRKLLEKLDRRYGFSEKSKELREAVMRQMYDADQQLGFRRKARNWTSNFQLRLPTYRRQLSSFLDTPLGKFFSTCFFLWFFLSGWLFRIMFFSMWILPFAAPLLIGTISRNAIIEGACPACKTRFIGSRSQVVLCRNCRNVVWQPRQDFSRNSSDPTIIDVDVEEK